MRRLTKDEHRRLYALLREIESLLGYDPASRYTQAEWSAKATHLFLNLTEHQPELRELMVIDGAQERFRTFIAHHFRSDKRREEQHMRALKNHAALALEDLSSYPITGPGIRVRTIGEASEEDLRRAIEHAEKQKEGLEMSLAVWRLARAYKTGVDVAQHRGELETRLMLAAMWQRVEEG